MRCIPQVAAVKESYVKTWRILYNHFPLEMPYENCVFAPVTPRVSKTGFPRMEQSRLDSFLHCRYKRALISQTATNLMPQQDRPRISPSGHLHTDSLRMMPIVIVPADNKGPFSEV
jgi:hypothetical protein